MADREELINAGKRVVIDKSSIFDIQEKSFKVTIDEEAYKVAVEGSNLVLCNKDGVEIDRRSLENVIPLEVILLEK